jgi:hypothetical protein
VLSRAGDGGALSFGLLTERSERLDAIMLLYTRNATGISVNMAYSLFPLSNVEVKKHAVGRFLDILEYFWIH